MFMISMEIFAHKFGMFRVLNRNGTLAFLIMLEIVKVLKIKFPTRLLKISLFSVEVS